jgi:UDP-N-acetylglucosamine transferase subunit ALG13
MIFVTVGSDLPFDRLVRVVDQWALTHRRSDVFAQIGDTDLRPSHVAYRKFLEPKEFSQHIASASTIISHAGMGTILSALRAEKPILVMPRLHALHEVRNEHQLATARRLSAMGKVSVAFDEDELWKMLDRLNELKPKGKIEAFASEDLLTALRDFITRG